MKKVIGLMVTALGALVMGSACTAEMQAAEEEVATDETALCSNSGGVNSVMTALAVAAGKEMRRWLPMRDFRWNYSTNRLELSEHAPPRCADRYCKNTRAVLAMQDAPANTVRFPGNIYLDPVALRNALRNNWNEQVACSNNNSCPQEAYDLQYTNWEWGSCDVKYFFNVYHQGSSTRITDSGRLNGLADNLVFLGYPENRMLNFYIRNGQVSVDPTGGLNDGGTAMSGSCTVACSKFSAWDVSGQCCSCNGSARRYRRSPFSSYMYLCQ
jgi:hypothetical protein